MDRLGIVKLNGSNYSTWKTKVEFLLIRDDLWKYVTEARPEAGAGGATAATVSTWDGGDQRARATIGLLLEDNQLNLIKGSKTAKQTWDQLKGHYEKASLTSKVSLLKAICDKRYTDGEDIEQHVFEMEELFERLTVAGQVLDNNLQVAMVLRSLPESFNTLTTALESRAENELTLELIKSKLADEVSKRRPGARGESVLKAESKKQKMTCHFCQKPGHKQKDCRAMAKQAAGNQSKTRPQGEKRYTPRVKAAHQENQEDESEPEYAFAASNSKKMANAWVIDSGATSHMCVNLDLFEEFDDSVQQEVILADGKKTSVKGIGTCHLIFVSPEGGHSKVKLTEVFYVPDFDSNLLSVKKLTVKGATIVFDAGGCRIFKNEKVIGGATSSGGLYYLAIAQEALVSREIKHTPRCQHTWHRILGHRDHDAVQELETKGLATGIKIEDCRCRVVCECCLEGKLTRLPFPKQSEQQSSQALDLIHSDVCGPMRTPTPAGCRYFVTLIDDFTRYCVVYFLKNKSEVSDRIKEYIRYVKTLFGRTPKVIRSDQGGEYQNEALDRFCKEEGIRQQFTVAYTPQQNGVAERKNRSLIEMARCMILDSRLPLKYWAEAVNTATYLQNRLPTRAVEKTPIELWSGSKPDLSHLKIFGSPAYVWIPEQKRSKLEAKSRKLLFVGYSLQHKAYRFMDPENDKLTVGRDAVFLTPEELRATEPQKGSIIDYPFRPAKVDNVPVVAVNEYDEDSDSSDDDFNGYESTYENFFNQTTDDEDLTLEEAGPAEGQEEQHAETPRRSDRANKGKPPCRYGDAAKLVSEHQHEPGSYQEAMDCPEREQWKRAMEEEIESIQENATWEIVQLPADRKAIGSKWIFKKKLDDNGNVIRYKARLVAQGYNQKYGTDYDQVFAPVAKQTTLRTILTIAARRNLLVQHVDVKTAYLYGELSETIYMKQPAGFTTGSKDDVCRLRKSLYGLKQAGRVWNEKISEVLRNLGYVPSESDPCLYVRDCRGEKSFILLYVDDMLILTHDQDEYERVCKFLQQHFKITCLGAVSNYLGIQMQRMQSGHFLLNQSAYIRRVAAKFGQDKAKPSHIPMDPGFPNTQQMEEKPTPRNEEFQSLVGALLYIAVNTRPDIAISASILGRKVSRPTEADWTEARRTLRYLNATADLKLKLGDEGPLEVYVDADWAGDCKDRKSNTGFVFQLGGPISWTARKQQCVTLSSTEAEYVALSEASRELLWIRKLLKDVGEAVDEPITVREDNQSCIAMLRSEGANNRTKHIDTRYNFVKELVSTGVMDVVYCPTELMIADVLTKPLARVKLGQLRSKIGLQRIELEEE